MFIVYGWSIAQGGKSNALQAQLKTMAPTRNFSSHVYILDWQENIPFCIDSISSFLTTLDFQTFANFSSEPVSL